MRLRRRGHTAALERELDYLLAEEREERNERRGLEQRGAGLLGALLIAFPVAATVAKDVDLADHVQLAGLVLLGLVLLGALLQLGGLARALGPPQRERNRVRRARRRVGRSLAHGDLAAAVRHQREIVKTIRHDNGRLVRRVRTATARLPLTLGVLLLALALLIAAADGPEPPLRGPAGPPGAEGPQGPQGPRGPRGPAAPAPSQPSG